MISFDPLDEDLQSKFAAILEGLFEASSNAFDMVQTEETILTKTAQKFGERGTILVKFNGFR